MAVTLQDQLPIGLTYDSSDPGGTHVDGVVIWDLGTIVTDTCKSVSIIALVDFGLPDGTVLIDTAGVIWRDSDGNGYGPATDTAETEVNPALILTKRAQSAEVVPGGTINYIITYENRGTTTLTGVVVTEFYDPNVEFVSATPPPDLGTNNQWTIGSLAPGASGNIQLAVQVAEDLPSGAILRNDVRITSDQGAEAEDPEKTTVTPPPIMLQAEKTDELFLDSDGNGIPSPGDTLLYKVIIVNSSSEAVTGVAFNDSPDPNTTLVVGSVQTSQGIVTSGNRPGDVIVAVQIGTIPAGGSVTISFQVMINDPLPYSVTHVANQGIISSNELPDEPTDDPDTRPDDDPTVTPVTIPIGGVIVPISTGELLFPWIGLAALASMAAVAVVAVRKRKA
jgi:uncharacterized repeat protein (TIGR01451 family)